MNIFQQMMQRSARQKSNIETKPWLCTGCSKRFPTEKSYLGHLGAKKRDQSLTHIDTPRSIQPTARRGKVLPKHLQDEDESDDEYLENIKEVLNPQEQRVLAAHRPRIGISKMPDGWTKEKILKTFNAPELEGYRMQWIEQWNGKYDSYPLSKQKLN